MCHNGLKAVSPNMADNLPIHVQRSDDLKRMVLIMQNPISRIFENPETRKFLQELVCEFAEITELGCALIGEDGDIIVNELAHPLHEIFQVPCVACRQLHYILSQTGTKKKSTPARCEWADFLTCSTVPLRADGKEVAKLYVGPMLAREPTQEEVKRLVERSRLVHAVEDISCALEEVRIVNDRESQRIRQTLMLLTKAVEGKLNAEKRLAQMQALQRATAAVSSHTHLDAILKAIVEEIEQVIPHDIAIPWMYNEARQTFRAFGSHGRRAAAKNVAGMEFTKDEGFIGWVATHRKPLWLNHIEEAKEQGAFSKYPKVLEEEGTQSYLGVPLEHDGELRGVFAVESRQPDAFTENDVEIFSTFSKQVSQAIAEAQMREAKQRYTERIEKLHGIGTSLAEVLEVDDLMSKFMEVTTQVLQCESGRLHLWDKERKMFVLRAGLNANEKSLIGKATFKLGEGIVGFIAETGESVMGSIEEVQKHPKWLGKYDDDISPYLPSGRFFSCLDVPVRSRGKIIGALSLHNKKDANDRVTQFTDEDQQIAEILGTQIGLAVENAELFEAQRELSILSELNEILTSTTDFAKRRDRLLGRIAETAMKLPNVERSSMRLIDPVTDELYIAAYKGRGWAKKQISRRYKIGEAGIGGKVAQTQKPELWPDVEKCPYFIPLFDGIRSHISVPIICHGETFGVLSVSCSQVNGFNQPHLNMLEQLAKQTAVVLENVELFAKAGRGEIEGLLNTPKLSDKILTQVVKKINGLVGGKGCSLFLRNRATDRFVLKVTTGVAHGDTDEPIEPSDFEQSDYNLGEGLTGWIAKHGHPLRICNVRDEDELKTLAEDLYLADKYSELPHHDGGPFLGVPLKSQGKVIGVLRVADHIGHREFTTSDEQLLTSIAHCLVIALERNRQVKKSKILRESDRLIASQQGLDSVLQKLVEQATKLVSCEAAHMRIRKGNSAKLILRASVGHQSNLPRKEASIEREFNRTVFQTGQYQIVPDLYETDVSDGLHEITPQEYYGDLRSAALVPLKLAGKVIGILSAYKPIVDGFSKSDVELLDDLSNRAAIAYDKARALETAKRRTKELEALNKATLSMVSAADLEQRLDTILAAACQIARTDRGQLVASYLGEGPLETPMMRGPENKPGWKQADYGVIQKAAETGEPQIVDDVSTVDYYKECWTDTQSELAIPIKYEGKLLGVLNLESAEEAAFSNRTLEKLSPLVAAAAVVLHKERTFLELVEAEKKAALGLIAAGVAHELNTVLNNIDHCIYNIPFETEADEKERLLNTVQKEAARGSNIVNRLLEIVRSDTDETKPCDINDVVTDVVDLVEQQLLISDISVTMDMEANLPNVNANEEKLKQVFLNIITNARQAMEESGGTLTIQTRTGLGRRVDVRFTDTGVGMTEEQMKQVFNLFFTTKMLDKGTGLGLSLSKRIVERFGGQIGVESELGKGATFTVSLPMF
jgi:GAF domain-containing protein